VDKVEIEIHFSWFIHRDVLFQQIVAVSAQSQEVLVVVGEDIAEPLGKDMMLG
jgi:hypothetical protein